MKKDKAEKLYNAITNISDDIIEEAQNTAALGRKRSAVRRILAAAACICFIAVFAAEFLPFKQKNNNTHSILQWTENFEAKDYFKYASNGRGTETLITDSIIETPYADTKDFSFMRSQMEAAGIIPKLEDYPLFHCTANYNADGSIYSVYFNWGRREDIYRDLEITAAYQELGEIHVKDLILIEYDEDGNVIEPTITVTERDGVQIVAEGREDQNKTIMCQTDNGWYKIEGSFENSYESVVMLLDWLWEHPLEFSYFA